jgi:hypothetical protein
VKSFKVDSLTCSIPLTVVFTPVVENFAQTEVIAVPFGTITNTFLDDSSIVPDAVTGDMTENDWRAFGLGESVLLPPPPQPNNIVAISDAIRYFAFFIHFSFFVFIVKFREPGTAVPLLYGTADLFVYCYAKLSRKCGIEWEQNHDTNPCLPPDVNILTSAM